ncbi:CHC2 zinc finger domain-containing protein [uncultured Tateyamaria sp.]|uniref:CHC2 zinc finger domain-containing protein n=1 Tax=uncultured Tateyamaria sp. TaxID=455651 RepID=UPI002632AB75|nr:CHC2 zinc finger domain-containing protein [uncultured Tateyamaria sp.]
MPRISDDEVLRLKQDVSLLEWVKAEGFETHKQGKDWVILCPFHEEKTPSCVITPAKNLYHCFGCGAAGSILDWVMQRQKVSFPHAVEILRSGSSGMGVGQGAKKNPIEPIMPMDVDAKRALGEVITYYHSCLNEDADALAFLAKRGLDDPALIETFQLGYCNRTLGYRLPSKHTKAGKTIRNTLLDVGIYRQTRFEHFGGCLVVPIFGDDGSVTEVYGRKIRPDHKIGKKELKHGYLPGAHKGVWNAAAFEAADEIILCEALLDAMSFWRHGFRNVTAIYGTSGFSEDIKQAFVTHGIKRVFIAFDADEAGGRAAEKHGTWFAQHGIEVRRVHFPKGMDANAYALKVQPAVKALDLLLRNAELVHAGKDAGDAAVSSSSSKVVQLAADQTRIPQTEITLDVGADQITAEIGPRSYRIRGFAKNSGYGALRINLMLRVGEFFFIDMLDLYHARQRAQFVTQAAVETGIAEDRIKRDLGQLLLRLEALQAEAQAKETQLDAETPEFAQATLKQAQALLHDPKLVDAITTDFAKLGVVGEDSNLLTAYLAATSRKLSKPLAVMIQSSSAAGKSSVMETVLGMMPVDERVQYSALTGQSLFYMGETNLKNKILAIAEEEGASNASYALKLLQSEGQITIASTGKDDSTGQLVTKEYKVEGPVMLMLTTTAIDIDEELMNRCLVLSVNETRAQTDAIHKAQRHAQTLDGLLANLSKDAVQQKHRAAQYLLKPLHVVNPFADQLGFANGQTRTRRDHMKYLSLIASIALLHQYQRDIKTVTHEGKEISYVEVMPADIILANRLAKQVLSRTLDELPPQTRKLLIGITDWVTQEAKEQGVKPSSVGFKRKELRQQLGWSDTQLKLHLNRLVEMEYLHVTRKTMQGGIAYEYQLVQGVGSTEPNVELIDPAAKPATGPPKPKDAQGPKLANTV